MARLVVFQPGYRLNNDDDLNANFALLSNGGGLTYTDNITAFAGGGRTSAVPLTTNLNRVTTVGTAADSVALPAAVGGQSITIINAAATNAMQVFAAVNTSDTINGVAAATGISVAAGKTIELVSFVGAWHGILSA